MNRVADYLGVRREYLWQIAGLLEDMEYRDEMQFTDPRLRFHLAQADKLSEPARNLIVDILKTTISYFQQVDTPTVVRRDDNA